MTQTGYASRNLLKKGGIMPPNPPPKRSHSNTSSTSRSVSLTTTATSTFASSKRALAGRAPSEKHRPTAQSSSSRTLKLSQVIKDVPNSDPSKLSVVERYITKIDAVPPKYHTVDTLFLSNNALTTLTGVKQFTHLRVLSVANNCIADFSDLEELKVLKKLTNLNLEYNPVTQMPNYRYHLLGIVPTLKNLDSKDITFTERQTYVEVLKTEKSNLNLMHSSHSLIQKLEIGIVRLRLHDELRQTMRLCWNKYHPSWPIKFACVPTVSCFKAQTFLDLCGKHITIDNDPKEVIAFLRREVRKARNVKLMQVGKLLSSVSGGNVTVPPGDNWELGFNEVFLSQQNKTAELIRIIEELSNSGPAATVGLAADPTSIVCNSPTHSEHLIDDTDRRKRPPKTSHKSTSRLPQKKTTTTRQESGSRQTTPSRRRQESTAAGVMGDSSAVGTPEPRRHLPHPQQHTGMNKRQHPPQQQQPQQHPHPHPHQHQYGSHSPVDGKFTQLASPELPEAHIPTPTTTTTTTTQQYQQPLPQSGPSVMGYPGYHPHSVHTQATVTLNMNNISPPNTPSYQTPPPTTGMHGVQSTTQHYYGTLSQEKALLGTGSSGTTLNSYTQPRSPSPPRDLDLRQVQLMESPQSTDASYIMQQLSREQYEESHQYFLVQRQLAQAAFASPDTHNCTRAATTTTTTTTTGGGQGGAATLSDCQQHNQHIEHQIHLTEREPQKEAPDEVFKKELEQYREDVKNHRENEIQLQQVNQQLQSALQQQEKKQQTRDKELNDLQAQLDMYRSQTKQCNERPNVKSEHNINKHHHQTTTTTKQESNTSPSSSSSPHRQPQTDSGSPPPTVTSCISPIRVHTHTRGGGGGGGGGGGSSTKRRSVSPPSQQQQPRRASTQRKAGSTVTVISPASSCAVGTPRNQQQATAVAALGKLCDDIIRQKVFQCWKDHSLYVETYDKINTMHNHRLCKTAFDYWKYRCLLRRNEEEFKENRKRSLLEKAYVRWRGQALSLAENASDLKSLNERAEQFYEMLIVRRCLTAWRAFLLHYVHDLHCRTEQFWAKQDKLLRQRAWRQWCTVYKTYKLASNTWRSNTIQSNFVTWRHSVSHNKFVKKKFFKQWIEAIVIKNQDREKAARALNLYFWNLCKKIFTTWRTWHNKYQEVEWNTKRRKLHKYVVVWRFYTQMSKRHRTNQLHCQRIQRLQKAHLTKRTFEYWRSRCRYYWTLDRVEETVAHKHELWQKKQLFNTWRSSWAKLVLYRNKEMRANFDNVKSSLENTSQRTAGLDIENVKLMDRIHELIKENSQLKGCLDQKESENKQLCQSVEENLILERSLRQEIEAHKIKVVDIELENQTLRQQVHYQHDESAVDLTEQRIAVSRVEQHAQDLAKKLQKTMDAYNQAQDDLKLLKHEHQQSKMDSNQKLNSALQIVRALRQMLEEQESMMTSLENTKQAQDTKLGGYETTLVNTSRKFASGLDEKEQFIKQLQQKIHMLQNFLNTGENKFTEISCNIESKDSKIRQLEYELALVSNREATHTNPFATMLHNNALMQPNHLPNTNADQPTQYATTDDIIEIASNNPTINVLDTPPRTPPLVRSNLKAHDNVTSAPHNCDTSGTSIDIGSTTSTAANTAPPLNSTQQTNKHQFLTNTNPRSIQTSHTTTPPPIGRAPHNSHVVDSKTNTPKQQTDAHCSTTPTLADHLNPPNIYPHISTQTKAPSVDEMLERAQRDFCELRGEENKLRSQLGSSNRSITNLSSIENVSSNTNHNNNVVGILQQINSNSVTSSQQTHQTTTTTTKTTTQEYNIQQYQQPPNDDTPTRNKTNHTLLAAPVATALTSPFNESCKSWNPSQPVLPTSAFGQTASEYQGGTAFYSDNQHGLMKFDGLPSSVQSSPQKQQGGVSTTTITSGTRPPPTYPDHFKSTTIQSTQQPYNSNSVNMLNSPARGVNTTHSPFLTPLVSFNPTETSPAGGPSSYMLSSTTTALTTPVTDSTSAYSNSPATSGAVRSLGASMHTTVSDKIKDLEQNLQQRLALPINVM